MYDKIYDFCKIRNKGNCFRNGEDPTPRVEFLIKLVTSLGLEYELDTFSEEEEEEEDDEYDNQFLSRDNFRKSKFLLPEVEKPKNNFFNLILPGTSNRVVVAHHDVVNASIDNANDNSASCINAIALKLLVPELNVILLDGEEVGGIGSSRAAEKINAGDFGNIEWVLNLELTGRGGDLFFIGNYPGALSNRILSLFDCPIFNTPFNDSVIFRKAGIDSTVINPLPKKMKEQTVPSYFEPIFMNGIELDPSLLMYCHRKEDTVDKISTDDMKVFVEEVLYKIVTS